MVIEENEEGEVMGRVNGFDGFGGASNECLYLT
jgi:hypothetical protein